MATLTTPSDSDVGVYSAVLGPQGRLVIPAEVRKRLGYEPGTIINIWMDGDRIRMQSRGAAREEAKRLFRTSKRVGSIVDELISERRAEAARELSEGR